MTGTAATHTVAACLMDVALKMTIDFKMGLSFCFRHVSPLHQWDCEHPHCDSTSFLETKRVRCQNSSFQALDAEIDVSRESDTSCTQVTILDPLPNPCASSGHFKDVL